MNTKHGKPEDAPFDINHRAIVTYHADVGDTDDDKKQRRETRDQLSKSFEKSFSALSVDGTPIAPQQRPQLAIDVDGKNLVLQNIGETKACKVKVNLNQNGRKVMSRTTDLEVDELPVQATTTCSYVTASGAGRPNLVTAYENESGFKFEDKFQLDLTN